MRLLAATALLLAATGSPVTGAPELVDGEEGVSFDHVVTVRFAGKPEFPVTIVIRSAYLGPMIRSFLVTDEAPLSIHCRLPAGDYQLESVLTNPSARYWDDPMRLGGKDPAGFPFAVREGADALHLLGPRQEFFHRFKIEVIGPGDGFVAGKKAPLLSWKPVENAQHYRVSWTESKAPDKRNSRDGNMEVETPFFCFDLELTPGARYEWQVEAFDRESRITGFWGPCHFFADDQASQAFSHPPQRPDLGGFLGVSIGETDQPLSGIRVGQVIPGTPASLAGLQVGDVITKFAGVPMTDVSGQAFVAIARSQAPGSSVHIEFARGFSDPRPLTADVTMGKRPGFSP